MSGRGGAGPAFDWQAAHARLERAAQALGQGAGRSPAEVERILQERARALARPLAEAAARAATIETLVFSLAGERYGLEAERTLEAFSLRGLTPLPCAPPSVAGVIHHRGRIVPVFDLRALLGLPGGGARPEGVAITVEAREMTFALMATAVEGMARVPRDELSPPPPGPAEGRPAFVRGITRDMVAVLDLEAMAGDPRLLVNEEAG